VTGLASSRCASGCLLPLPRQLRTSCQERTRTRLSLNDFFVSYPTYSMLIKLVVICIVTQVVLSTSLLYRARLAPPSKQRHKNPLPRRERSSSGEQFAEDWSEEVTMTLTNLWTHCVGDSSLPSGCRTCSHLTLMVLWAATACQPNSRIRSASYLYHSVDPDPAIHRGRERFK